MKQALFLLFIFMFIGATNVGSNNTQPDSWKEWSPAPPAPLFSIQDISQIDKEESKCLALNIFFEAAVESTAGKLAVAHVTLNRVKSKKYPNSVCGVVKEGSHFANGFPKRDMCQFSWYCDGKHDIPQEGILWNKSKELATYVLRKHEELLDITDGATHYHADYISPPRWAHPKQKTARIDTHIFFNKTLRVRPRANSL